MSLKRRFSLLLATLGCLEVALFAIVPVTSKAENFENPKPGAPKSKVVDYKRIQTHPAGVPNKIPGGIAFDFLYTPDTALLRTSHPLTTETFWAI